MGAPEARRGAPIPPVVHRVWLGGPEPEWTAGFARTWEQPGWDLIQWDEAAVEKLFPLHNQAIFDAAEEIAPDHVGQLRSDVLRYEILQRFGGVYVDTDFECSKPIAPLLPGVACFAAWEVQSRWINNAIMGATPCHPFIRHLVAGLAANVRRRRGAKPNKLSGPQYLTHVYRRHGRDVTVFSQKLFYPYGWNELERQDEHFPDAYAKHWWANKRRERGVFA